jgi:hypothetical protein
MISFNCEAMKAAKPVLANPGSAAPLTEIDGGPSLLMSSTIPTHRIIRRLSARPFPFTNLKEWNHEIR